MSTDAITPDTTPNDRDNWGRFQQGNQLSRGNAGGGNAHKVASLNRSLLSCASDNTVAELFSLTLARAKGGDNTCLLWLLNKLTGKPMQSVEVTSVEPGTEKTQGTKLTAIFLSIIGDDPEKKAKFAAALRGESTGAPEALEVTNGLGD